MQNFSGLTFIAWEHDLDHIKPERLRLDWQLCQIGFNRPT